MSDYDPKFIAIVSYGTLIGWVVALILHRDNPSSLSAFHLRQSLGLYLTAVLFAWIPFVGRLIILVLAVFWVLGLIEAVRERQVSLPFIGDWYQQLLASIR